MRRNDLACHALHVAFFGLALRLAERTWAVAAASAGLYFAAFLVTHDAMHGSLRLGRRANDLALALGGALVGVSGHGARLLHLRHHARPFAPDDDEARCGTGPLWRAIALGPLNYARSPFAAWRQSPRRHRPWIALETALVAALAASCLASPKGRVALAVVVALNSAIGLWGVRLPHAPHPALVRAVELFAWLPWPPLLGVVTHETHHATPAVPAFTLNAAWHDARAPRGAAQARTSSYSARGTAQARTSSYSGVLSKTARAKGQTGLTFNPCA
jgi:fatty acid desaturase